MTFGKDKDDFHGGYGVVPKTYDRNIKSAKYYSSAVVGEKGYNPTIIYGYDASDNLVQKEEIFQGKKWVQTISGSGYGPPTTFVTYDPWEEDTTYSG
jgi:hypothetical protein